MNTTAVLKVISIAKEFSDSPGPRTRDEGEFSGEAFLQEILRPAFVQAAKEGHSLVVDLDGSEGYATSFLESAFGGLAREFDAKEILKVVTFKSDDEPYLVQEIQNYITDARKQ